MEVQGDDILIHYGTPHQGATPHSGRYPWDPTIHGPQSLKERTKVLQQKGMSEKEIAKYLGYKSTSDLRRDKSLEKAQRRAEQYAAVHRYIDQGVTSPTKIGRELGMSESSVRSLMVEARNVRNQEAGKTVDTLKSYLKDYKYVDVSKGTAQMMGVSNYKFGAAIKQLKNEGYSVYKLNERQVANPDQYTTMNVLCDKGISRDEMIKNKKDIAIVGAKVNPDMLKNRLGLKPVQSISSKKVMINYAEDGGINKDGVIEIRRGAKGLDLGSSNYAQVRIGVDGTHYLKGMAVYADDLPDGIDIRFNTNKHRGTPKMDVLKKMKTTADGKVDRDNPFGTSIKGGPEGQRGYLNIVREEGDWGVWAKTLSSQFLSKQSPALAKRQLDVLYSDKKAEFDEIKNLTNPVVKQHLLLKFADGCDSSAVDLKAAAMPSQSTSVILPVPSIKENQIYAPQYKNGTKVVLIRHPHGGIFEIPELTVNNNVSEAQKILGGKKYGTHAPRDAVGISPKTAEQLSGADFDGDSVIVIPNMYKGHRLVKTSPPLEQLKDPVTGRGWDPKEAYPGYPGMKVINPTHKQKEMGVVSNLITDMTLKGAGPNDIAKAVKYSMVVIDAEKHELDYRTARKDCEIESLKRRWQMQKDGKDGASTIISRAKSEYRVPNRELDRKNPINPETGEKQYVLKPRSYVNKDGKVIEKTIKSTKMAETKDARKLMSDNPAEIEIIYADHANRMKAMGNAARKESLRYAKFEKSPEAAKTYAAEVKSIKEKLANAEKQKPLERKAQILANTNIQMKLRENPSLYEDKDAKKKMKFQALAAARKAVGKDSKSQIVFTPKEWEAVQAHAISKSKLSDVLDYVDEDSLKSLATPRAQRGHMTDAKKSRAKSMSNLGYTQAEIAAKLGVSVSTVQRVLNE